MDFLALLGLRTKRNIKPVDTLIDARLKEAATPMSEEQRRIAAATRRRDEIGGSIPPLKGEDVQSLHGVLDKGTDARLKQASGESKEG